VIGAIIVNHDTSALARECVASIAAAADGAGDVEIVVVDSGSSPADRDALDGVGARVVALGNVGYAAAVNRGARELAAPFLLVSNADVVYLPGSLAELLEAARGIERCGAVGPELWWDREQTIRLPPNSDERAATTIREAAATRLGADRLERWVRRTERVRRAREPLAVPALSGASLLVTRPAFEALGGFDEGFSLYFEDADFCRRARACGYRLALVPRARVVHHYNQSAGRDPDAADRRFAESARRFARKHERPAVRRLAERAAAATTHDPPGPMDDLGVVHEPPRFAVDGGAGGEPALFLLSPLPGCVPAATAERPSGVLELPRELFERTAPGPQHVVALSRPDLRVVGAWRWVKAPRAERDAAAELPDITVRDCTAEDGDGIAALFPHVFGHELPAGVWHWKYHARAGTSCSQVAEMEGEIVSHVGCRRLELAWHGEPGAGFTVMDQMSDPAVRGRRVWQRVAMRVFERHVDGRDGLLVYGFPNERVRKAGEARQAWEAIAPVFALERPALDPAPRMPGELVVVERPPARWDAAWQRHEPAYGLLQRRDAAYLTWRYTARPDREYRFINAVDDGSLAVVSLGGERAHLMELIAPPGDFARCARLALAAEHVAAASGATSLDAWFPPWSEQARVLTASCGFTGHDAPHQVECTRRDPRLGLDWLAGSFFYSLGDWDVH
jgi:N-acetylglucosaminyl-diphospho-decaprenol L-rhamnosyltransferase